ncbi:MAG: glutathione S-transferase N-terminal domain-containing protein [Pseudomonadales bacterium]|jgi:glutathione S-transferase|tara:strand:- start:12014 stop:13132 length:1119 start_codon:yes stop_codon:yes gene_type:complete
MSNATLYGIPISLYTGRARSYLIKAGVAYNEVSPITEHYIRDVVPQAGGRAGMPTLETAEGSVIRDGAAIIDHYETLSGNTYSPTTPKQKVLSRLFDVVGAEGLLRPAMHYRWDFPEENLNLLRFHFQSAIPRGPGREEKADKATDRMRAAGKGFGAVAENFSVIEALYIEWLEALNAHFSAYPYLFGSKPSIGDFGMIAPLYGHLGRDPKPLSLMQAKAVQLYRWVERMNRPELDLVEFEDQTGEYLPSDEIPESLITLLQQVAIDFVPETIAAANCINEWLDKQQDLHPGTEAIRGVGLCSFELRGATINALAQPYRFYLLQRVQDLFESLDSADQADVLSLFEACNLQSILTTKLNRRIGRENNLEVWL